MRRKMHHEVYLQDAIVRIMTETFLALTLPVLYPTYLLMKMFDKFWGLK